MKDKCYKFDSEGLMYRDEEGTGGYGDSCAETFRYYHLIYCRALILGDTSTPSGKPKLKEMAQVLPRYFIRPGVSVRAPLGKLPPEWPQPPENDIPGDQLNPLWMALGIGGYERELADCVSAHKERYYFFPNGDLPTPHSFNILRRAQGLTPKSGYDLGLYGTVLTRIGVIPFWDSGTRTWEHGDPDEVADDINLVHSFLQAEYRGKTWWSEKAKSRYIRERIVSMGTTELGYKNKVLGAIAWYYRTSPWLTALYEPLIEKIFRD